MKQKRAFKVELDPTNAQMTAFRQHCGAARFVYNWGLNKRVEDRKAGLKPLSCYALDTALRAIIDEQFPWLREVSGHCRQGALANLDKAYANFFDRCKKGIKGKKAGFPKFKKRKKGLGGFVVFHYTIESNSVRIARVGMVRLKEKGYLPLGGYGKNTDTVRFYSARVTERAGRWYLSVQVEVEVQDPKLARDHAVGVDVGIKTLATCSDGMTFPNPRAMHRSRKKLRRLQRAMSRKIEAAKKTNRPLRECRNFQKNKLQVTRLHAKIADLRKHHLHHASHVITRKSSVIGLESLNIAGMMKNRKLAKALADASFGELLRQIKYKAEWRGGQVVVASQWFASSKTCNACGLVNIGLTLSQRKWTCECGVAHERDLNAAKNLLNVAANRAETKNACGGFGSGLMSSSSETIPDEAGCGRRVSTLVSPAPVENNGISVWNVGKNGQLAWC